MYRHLVVQELKGGGSVFKIAVVVKRINAVPEPLYQPGNHPEAQIEPLESIGRRESFGEPYRYLKILGVCGEGLYAKGDDLVPVRPLHVMLPVAQGNGVL